MSLLQETKLICQQYNISPTKSKGQNFLINEEIYQQVIEAAKLTKGDTVLEVGPGLGFLTNLLCQKAGQVTAVELDTKIYNYLKIVKELKKLNNLKLSNQNILDLKDDELAANQFKIVANLPYNITSIFLRKFLSTEYRPTEMVLMLQKEVAERIVAKPGKMSLLAVSVQFYSQAEIIAYVPKDNFWPQPKVDSAIIKISQKSIKSLKLKVNEKNFFRIVKIGFSAKRKKLINNLANGLHRKPTDILPTFEKFGFDENIRAQELGVGDWIKLANIIKI